MIQDLRFAFRILAQRPAVTVIAIILLALGIGANTVVFSLIHSILLRPLPGVQYPRTLLSLLTGLLSGMAPALAASRSDLTTAFKDAAPASGLQRSRPVRGLVIAQVGLSLTLLAGAGLVGKSLGASCKRIRNLMQTACWLHP
jgi:hypothetical protein